MGSHLEDDLSDSVDIPSSTASASPPPPIIPYDEPQNEKEATALSQLRQSLPTRLPNSNNNDDATSYFLSSNGTLLRYLRARKLHLPKTLSLISKSYTWRSTTHPQTITCPLCTTNPHAHNMRIVGWDSQFRPVIYTCFSQANSRWDVPTNILHLISILESASSLLSDLKTPSGKWVIVVDYDGFGLRDNSIKMAIQFVEILNHYPERLGCALLMNAPKIFGTMWSVMRRILDEVTVSKVRFLDCPSDKEGVWGKELVEMMGEEMGMWLIKEIKENCIPENKYAKKYWEWMDAENKRKKDHDGRGMASYVQSDYYVSPVLDKFCQSVDLLQGKKKKEEEAPIASTRGITKQTVLKASSSLTSGTF